MKPENTENLRVARIENVNGAPALTVDGQPVPLMSYQWALGRTIDDDPAHDSRWMIENMSKVGVKLFFNNITIADPEKLDESYDGFMEQMELLVDVVPDALVVPWISIVSYRDFEKKYPDDVIEFEDGSKDHYNRWQARHKEYYPRFTFASTAWKAEAGALVREFIRRLCASKYARNIIGYFFFPGDFEFSYYFEFNTLEHCIDFSPAMKLAFRNYLIEKYRGDERLLRKAWNDENVTFETAKIPDLKQRTVGDFGYFRDPSKCQQVYDYVTCYNDMNVDKFIYLSQVCKEATDGKHVVGAFYGYLMNQDLQMGGQTQFKKALNCPTIDIFSAPYTYENRGPGNFASMRMLIKSLNKHGKLYFAEADSFMGDSVKWAILGHSYPDQTPEEDEGIIKRDFTYPLCEGSQAWWIDWSSGVSQYKEDGLQPVMKKLVNISEESFENPCGPVSDIAGVLDAESLHVPACNARNHDDKKTLTNPILLMQHSLDRFRVDELPRIGSPVDFYETDDVICDGDRKYRMYVFMNQYIADARERELIEKNLKKDGNVLIWMYGAGLIDPEAEKTLSLENAKALTGFNLGCEMRETRCVMTAKECELLPSLKAGEKIGDYLRERISRKFTEEELKDPIAAAFIQPYPPMPEPNLVNPLIYVDDPDAIPLATFDDGGKVGLAVKQFEDWTSVYVGAPCLQSHVMRDLAKLAKAHLYVDDHDEIIYANESYIGIHTACAGEKTIHLKAPADVKEAFEEREIGKQITEFTEKIPAHATRLYKIN